MAHYYLANPLNPNVLLRNAFEQATVFKSVVGNDYFLLSIAGTGRMIARYDIATNTTFGSDYPVPVDWDGEPLTYSIDGDAWDALYALGARGDEVAARVIRDLDKRVLNGDIVAIRRAGETPTYRIRCRSGIARTTVSPYP
jgi:hypothetical protein